MLLSIYSIQYILHRELIIFMLYMIGARHMTKFFCFQFSKKFRFFSLYKVFVALNATHRPPEPPICICIIW